VSQKKKKKKIGEWNQIKYNKENMCPSDKSIKSKKKNHTMNLIIKTKTLKVIEEKKGLW
jgi:hypothetical protein